MIMKSCSDYILNVFISGVAITTPDLPPNFSNFAWISPKARDTERPPGIIFGGSSTVFWVYPERRNLSFCWVYTWPPAAMIRFASEESVGRWSLVSVNVFCPDCPLMITLESPTFAIATTSPTTRTTEAQLPLLSNVYSSANLSQAFSAFKNPFYNAALGFQGKALSDITYLCNLSRKKSAQLPHSWPS